MYIHKATIYYHNSEEDDKDGESVLSMQVENGNHYGDFRHQITDVETKEISDDVFNENEKLQLEGNIYGLFNLDTNK